MQRLIDLLFTYYLGTAHPIKGGEPYGNSYAFVVLRALDLNVASLLWRNYGVTISAMTGLALRAVDPPAWAVLLGAFLTFCQTNHCEEAIAADRERARQALKIVNA
jgi:hypothetical protein